MLSLLGYRLFNQPEICSGDQDQFTGHDRPQLPMVGKQAGLGPQS
jgi:hypothetical protein